MFNLFLKKIRVGLETEVKGSKRFCDIISKRVTLLVTSFMSTNEKYYHVLIKKQKITIPAVTIKR